MIKHLVLLALAAVLCVICTSHVICRVPNSKRTLVLIDGNDVKNTHSQFFSQLQSRGHQLDFYLTSQAHGIKLSQYGEYNYDHVIIMSSKSSSMYDQIGSDQTNIFFCWDDQQVVILLTNNNNNSCTTLQ